MHIKEFGPDRQNALYESLAWVRAAKDAGFRNVRCCFLGRGVFRVEVQ